MRGKKPSKLISPSIDGKGSNPPSLELITVFGENTDPAVDFEFDRVPKSTELSPEEAVIKPKTTDEILQEYDDLEEDEDSVTVDEIPDDTVDQIIARINENEVREETSEEENV